MSTKKTGNPRPPQAPGSPALIPNTTGPARPGRRSQPPLFGPEESPTEIARRSWWQQAERAAWQLIRTGEPFDAHAITEAVGSPYPGDGRKLADLIRSHARAGHIQHYEYTRSRRPTSGAVVAVWEPTPAGRLAALRVLYAHLIDQDQTAA